MPPSPADRRVRLQALWLFIDANSMRGVDTSSLGKEVTTRMLRGCVSYRKPFVSDLMHVFTTRFTPDFVRQ